MSEKIVEKPVRTDEEISPEMVQEALALMKKQHQIELEEEFKKLDKNGDGFVDRKELAIYLKEYFGNDIPSLFERIVFGLMDENYDDKITFEEFVRYWDWPEMLGEFSKADDAKEEFQPPVALNNKINLTPEQYKAQLLEKFKSADKDGSGFIDRKEFHDYLLNEFNGEVEPAIERVIFAIFDENADGKISLEEYTVALEKTLVDILTNY